VIFDKRITLYIVMCLIIIMMYLNGYIVIYDMILFHKSSMYVLFCVFIFVYKDYKFWKINRSLFKWRPDIYDAALFSHNRVILYRMKIYNTTCELHYFLFLVFLSNSFEFVLLWVGHQVLINQNYFEFSSKCTISFNNINIFVIHF